MDLENLSGRHRVPSRYWQVHDFVVSSSPDKSSLEWHSSKISRTPSEWECGADNPDLNIHRRTSR